MEKIFSAKDIVVGQRYRSELPLSATYVGCQNYDTQEKFMLITDCGDREFEYRTVSSDETFPIWTNGFVQI